MSTHYPNGIDRSFLISYKKTEDWRMNIVLAAESTRLYGTKYLRDSTVKRDR